MTTGFDLLGSSRNVQGHWARRGLAYGVDLLVVFVPLFYFLSLVGRMDLLTIAIVPGVALFLYSGVLEAHWGTTAGKALLRLELHGTKGHPVKAFARNFPKVFWYAFPMLDAGFGLLLPGDSRQRFSDRALGTTVLHRDAMGISVSPRPVS